MIQRWVFAYLLIILIIFSYMLSGYYIYPEIIVSGGVSNTWLGKTINSKICSIPVNLPKSMQTYYIHSTPENMNATLIYSCMVRGKLKSIKLESQVNLKLYRDNIKFLSQCPMPINVNMMPILNKWYISMISESPAKNRLINIVPHISLSPNFGHSKIWIWISGWGFASNATFDVYMDTILLGSGVTDFFGNIDIYVQIPGGVDPGYYRITVIDEYGNQASEVFKVTEPKLIVTPESGPIGTKVSISASGLAPYQLYTIVFDGVLVGGPIFYSDENGNLDLTGIDIYVPASTQGPHNISLLYFVTAPIQVERRYEVITYTLFEVTIGIATNMDIKELKDKIDSLNKSVIKLNTLVNELKSLLADIYNRVMDQINEIYRLTDKLNNTINNLSNELSKISDETTKLKNYVDENLKNLNTKISNLNSKLENSIETLSTNLENVRSNLTNMNIIAIAVAIIAFIPGIIALKKKASHY